MNSNPIETIRKIALGRIMATLPGVLENPDVAPADGTEGDRSWKVTVFDNEVNTYQEVIAILMMATECDAEEAYIEAWEIDHFGRSDVHFASESACAVAASIISEIGIKVEVSQEQ